MRGDLDPVDQAAVAAVVAGVLGLVSLYLGAVTQALAEVPRSSPLPDYPGRALVKTSSSVWGRVMPGRSSGGASGSSGS